MLLNLEKAEDTRCWPQHNPTVRDRHQLAKRWGLVYSTAKKVLSIKG